MSASVAVKPAVLIRIPMMEPWHEELAEEFELLYPRDAPVAISELHKVSAIVTNASTGAPTELIEQMPALKLIALFSAGYDGIDIDGLRARGISLTSTAGVNAAAVADHAIGLTLAVQRRIPYFDQAVRRGGWTDLRGELSNTISGKRLGVVGMGHVRRAVARRAKGFDMEIAYTSTTQNVDLLYQYIDNVETLALHSDILVLCCPGGERTHHLIGANEMGALGPDGVLINVARGTVVDTNALISALTNRTIAGAGLDVYEGEPTLPIGLVDIPNVVITPHIAGFTQSAFRASFEAVRQNLRTACTGRPLPSRVTTAKIREP